MSEFTLRYKGHFHQMKLLKNLGYFNNDPINVNTNKTTTYGLSQILFKKITTGRADYEKALSDLGFYDKTCQYDCPGKKISPRKVAANVLSKRWKMTVDDKDVLVMRVQADDGKKQHTADIYAEHDNMNSAMALTTGGTAALATRAVLTGEFNTKGVFPLENVIKEKPELLEYFSHGLQKSGVSYSQYESKLAKKNQKS